MCRSIKLEGYIAVVFLVQPFRRLCPILIRKIPEGQSHRSILLGINHLDPIIPIFCRQVHETRNRNPLEEYKPPRQLFQVVE